MIVKNQLKHLIVLLQESGGCGTDRLSKLLFYTPIKAEVASEQTKELLNLAIRLDLVKREGKIYVTNVAPDNNHIDKLTDSEFERLKSSITENEDLLSEISDITGQNGHIDFVYNDIIHRLLFELGFIKKITNGYQISSELLRLVRTKDIIWKFNGQENNTEIGIFAEKTVYAMEFDKLSSTGMSKKLKHVSLENDALGYDIKSYDIAKRHEVYIEVKGTTSNHVRFFLTAKEFSTAKELKSRYVIKVVCGINLAKKTYTKIVNISNAAKSLSDYEIVPQIYRVSEPSFF
jgi:hypothetical protein